MTDQVAGVIILEGPDSAGKTTLAKYLTEKYNAEYIHCTWSKDLDIWQHHSQALYAAQRVSQDRLVVIDRLWPSEYVYGQVFRSGAAYSPWAARSMDRVFHRLSAHWILCTPRDVNELERLFNERRDAGGEMFNAVRDVAVRYIDWTYGSIVRPHDGDYVEQLSCYGGMSDRVDVTTYDVFEQGHKMKSIAHEAVEMMLQKRAAQFPAGRDYDRPNFLGYLPWAKYLFVGERLGDPNGWSKWPFYGEDNSADFLNKTLHQIKFDERLAVWTNALDVDRELNTIFDAKPTLIVIALGRYAEGECKRRKVPVTFRIPHPQWARRFNHFGANGTPYSQLIKDIVYDAKLTVSDDRVAQAAQQGS